jgi:phenylalanyl-tRNA synthetase alpha chain
MDVQAVDALRDGALRAFAAAVDLAALEQARVEHLGRRSPLAEAQKSLGQLDDEGRRRVGALLNELKQAVTVAHEERIAALEGSELTTRLEAERLDLTAPPRRVRPGRPHLLTQVEREIVDVFVGLGFGVADGPEVEAGRFNFDLLNIPPDHPARGTMDTIYVDEASDVVLRTHTSPVQVRTMLAQEPPIAVVCPGRVYRADAVDATHSPVFTQVEGLLVAEGITMAHLRGTLLAFARALFGEDREVRLRPSFFPFTEPSAEVDVSFDNAAGWLEILGSGMVDPAVLEACGIDAERYSGFAFGIGVERVAMLRHGVKDIRDLYDADARFLAAF